jgi:cytosine/adenosine deaminase-related metal-dependent hydrolase
LGPERAAYSYAWAAFLEKGVVLAFGTDYPVEPVALFRGLYAAVTRKSEDGKKEYCPAQKLSLEQAIAAYTTGSAFAEFAEKNKGTLAPGMLADLVVLDSDITSVPPERDSRNKGAAHGGRREDGLKAPTLLFRKTFAVHSIECQGKPSSLKSGSLVSMDTVSREWESVDAQTKN